LLVPNAALRFRPADAKNGAGRPGGNEKSQKGGKEWRKEKGGAEPSRTGTVYVIENGALKPVRLALGITDNRFTEVPGGELKEGTAVVVEDTRPPAKASPPQGMRLF
jgi:HlyD family secretion protein